MKSNFFRKDLNLKNRWWHRLLSIVFIFSLFMFVICGISDIFRDRQVQQWKKAETLSERITSEINPVSSFIKVGEKIGKDDRTYVLNNQPDAYYKSTLNNVYCSTELSNNIEKIKSERQIKSLFIRDLYGTNNVPLETFTNYIKQNNIHCLIVDAYTTYDSDGQAIGKLSFLEPKKTYQDDWSFYEKSSDKTITHILEMLVTVFAISFAIFIGIIVIYYKIFLYIIFGCKKNE